jgi:hypothetical protein
MDSLTTNHPETAPPSLGELFARYLSNPESHPVDSRPGLVEPYDSAVVHPVDAHLAWQGALASLAGVAARGTQFERPAEWTGLVQAHESYPAVAMVAGNYPQLMRDLPGLVQADNLADLLRLPAAVHELPGLSNWAARTSKSSFVARMLAAGVLRLAGQFDAAKALLSEDTNLSEGERQILQNERAGLAWNQGDRESAVREWLKLPVSAFGQFSLGMATLFEQPGRALPYLQSAIKLLAEEDPWRHLAGIYLALAEMRT